MSTWSDSDYDWPAVGEEPKHNRNLSPHQFALYRAEHRPPGEDLAKVESVGVHWTTKPLDYGYAHEPGYKRVVWHATVPGEHVADASDKYGEGEVVLKNRAKVRLTGMSTTPGPWGHVQVSARPEHPLDREVEIRGRQIK